jgi:radical SAM protein with 4Fe4S-binding SPASM domain
MQIQEPPFVIQVELTEGCNLRCNFCGLNGIRGSDNDFKFMTVELAHRITDEILRCKWTPRIEFAMHGEPSANPQMLDVLYVFRKKLRKTSLMMTSNGYGFMKDPTYMIDAVLTYVNTLALDWYENVKIVPKIIERYQGKHDIHYYPKDVKANPHTRRLGKDKLLVVVQDIAKATKGTHSTLNNHCGCGAPKNDNGQGKRCGKVFRELSIRWDGNVAICCNDWRGTYKIGNVMNRGLDELWNSKPMYAARQKLYQGQRDFGPCDGCDAVTYRTGLLPDKYGKDTVEEPDDKTEEVIRKALGKGVYTLPVLREWEKPASRP